MPVITTDVGGLAEVVKNRVTGYIVPPEDPYAIAEAVRMYYLNGAKPAFSENVRRESKHFSWDALVETITSFADASRN